MDGRECSEFDFIPNSDLIISKYFYYDTSTLELRDLNKNILLGKYNYKGTIIESNLTSANRTFIYLYSGISTRICELKKNISIPYKEGGIQSPLIISKDGKLYLSIGNIIYRTMNIYIYDISGKSIYEENIKLFGTGFQQINTELNSGVYLCKIIIDGKEYTQKIEITR